MATAKPPGEGSEYQFPDEKEPKKGTEAAAEVEIEIVDDAPEEDRGRPALKKPVEDPTDAELEGYTDGVKKRIGELTHARHDERRRAEATARERDEAVAVAQRLLAERKQIAERYNAGQDTFVSQAKEKAEGELKAAKIALKAAHEAFDTDAIVEAQAALSLATNKLEQAKNFRPTPLQVETDELQPRQSQQAPAVDPKTLSWQAENQWFGREGNEEHTSFALGLHQKLSTQGYVPGTDAYFAQINARMKSTFPDLFEDAPDDKKPSGSQKKPPTVVAPAARSTATGKIKLTSSQVALAGKLGLTPQQYAIEVARLQENQ